MSILLCVKCACRAKFCSYLTNKLYCRKIKSKLNRHRKIKKSGGTPAPETKTYSERTYYHYALIRRRNTSRNGGEQIERRTYVTHKPILQRLHPVAIVCLLVFVFLFPHAKNCAFIFLTHIQVRLFLTCGSPCVCSTRMRGVLLRSCHAGEVA